VFVRWSSRTWRLIGVGLGVCQYDGRQAQYDIDNFTGTERFQETPEKPGIKGELVNPCINGKLMLDIGWTDAVLIALSVMVS
jgi:hypothetical protein